MIYKKIYKYSLQLNNQNANCFVQNIKLIKEGIKCKIKYKHI